MKLGRPLVVSARESVGVRRKPVTEKKPVTEESERKRVAGMAGEQGAREITRCHVTAGGGSRLPQDGHTVEARGVWAEARRLERGRRSRAAR